MDLSGKRVLITGAGGFIGSHLAERLVAVGARTRAFLHYNALGSRGWLDASAAQSEIEFVAGDITDPETVHAAMKGVEIVFHLAALIAIPHSYQAPRSYVRTNIEGTLNVLQAARDAGVSRVVHTSTSEVYGTARRAPIDESHPLQAQSPYAASKIGADKIVVVTVRPFNTYGPRQSARAVIPTIIAQCLAGGPVRLGNLHPTRDLVFVADTVNGFLRAAMTEAAVGETVHLGTGREIRIGDLAALIAKPLGAEVASEPEAERIRPASSEVDRLVADASRARDLLGWEAQTSLEEGLKTTADWVRDNPSRHRGGAHAL
jgi:dTDP-glucose 4,6-dehydratase